MFIATLIAADRLTPHHVAEARERLAVLGAGPGRPRALDEGSAVDLPLERWAAVEPPAGCDLVVQPAEDRTKRLLVSDMDSTMITVECIDELADYAGCKPQVAAVTERAMRGELDFAAALRARVALLAGLPLATVGQCLRERVRPMAGAAALVATMRARGARAVLVSGGFTRFAGPVAERLGFDRVMANVLEVDGGRLTGRVSEPIVDARAKARALGAARAEWGIGPTETLAVGDGANDLPMIRAAGLGVAYHAKPVVAAEADAAIRHGDLTALLWTQGIARAQWVEPE